MRKDGSGEWVKIKNGSGKPRITQSGNEVRIRHTGQPIPLNLRGEGSVYLAVDGSGSMGGEKIEQARHGAIDFAEKAYKKGYITGLILFETEAVHLCGPQRDISVLRRHLESLVAGGTTNMTGAIDLAVDKLRGQAGSRVIVVVTDGMPDKPRRALRAAGRAKKKGIDIIAVGTDDADQGFLEKLVSRRELATVVHSDQLEKGIVSTAEMLPQGK
jgi:Mg-chelatase subunit ChlD